MLLCAPAFADTNIAATNNKDSGLSHYNPTQNRGSYDIISVQSAHYLTTSDSNRMIYNFTLPSEIPNTTITSIDFYLYCIGLNNQASYNIDVHKITQANWTENGVTWNKYDISNDWTNAGGDYYSTVIDHIARPTTPSTWYNWTLYGTNADNPLSLTWGSDVNIILKASTEDLDGTDGDYNQFPTKEYTDDITKRPYILITYIVNESTSTPFATTTPLNCIWPTNDDISIITSCNVTYTPTTSTSTLATSSIQMSYYYVPFILYYFFTSLVVISMFFVALYIYSKQ